MDKYSDFLKTNLFHDKEFALVALPIGVSKERVFYSFTKTTDGLIDTRGNKLTLQPFPDSNYRKSTDKIDIKDHYLAITQKAIDSIHAGELEKVVLARTKTIEHITRESLIGWYKNLLEKYPEAFVFILSTTEAGTWIGASPELLVEKKGTCFYTIALAATNKSLSPHWSPKDYDEHAQVASYLAQELTKPEIKNVTLSNPHTIRYGNLTHLKTDVSFSSNLGLQNVVGLIHPTPALCGYPKREALRFIQQNEAAPRSFYTGSMTIEKPNGDGVAFAFLRCGSLSDTSRLTLYAGCGVVGGSIPAQEWDESEAKIASVLSCL